VAIIERCTYFFLDLFDTDHFAILVVSIVRYTRLIKYLAYVVVTLALTVCMSTDVIMVGGAG